MRTRLHHSARTLAGLAALSLLAASCSSTPGSTPGTGQASPFQALRSGAPVTLQSDRDCGAVLEDLQSIGSRTFADWAMPQPGIAFDDAIARDGADFDLAVPTAGAAAEGSGAAPSAAAPDQAAVGGNNSDTNTQEAGIDEPDVVENDGDFVYLVDGEHLVILDGATAELVSRTALGAWGAQLLLQGDRLLVISGGEVRYGGPIPVEGGFGIAESELVDPARDVDLPADDIAREETPGEESPLPVDPPSFQAGTVIQLMDVADRSAPTVVETTEIEGFHVSTRVVDGVARVVVTSYPQIQPMIDVPAIALEAPPLDDQGAPDRDAAVSLLEDALADTTIEDWLPSFRTTTAAATSVEGQLVACEDVFVPEVNAGISETSILRVDFTDGFDPADTTTVVAEAGTVYASAETLYLAATQWIAPSEQVGIAADEWATALHAFDLRGDGAAAHIGAGAVPGSVLNQYSLSEYDGHLRVATTEGTPWGRSDASQSGVRVLRAESGVLEEVGAVTGLGVTETIQSVRYLGPVAYVVTFRQTDPLYVIDLSDPTDPRAVGELKIPGFSSYLHPTEPGRLIGVGRDADLDGRDRGFLVSLFDVSDPTDPKQLQTYTEADAWSAAGNDPKAFLYWAPESAVVLPIERYGRGGISEPRPLEVAPEPEQSDPDRGRDDPGDEIDQVEPAPPPDEPFEVDGDIAPESFQVGVLVLDVADGGITERGLVTVRGSYAFRSLVVQGQLWSIFDGAVAVSDFGDVESASVHAFR